MIQVLSGGTDAASFLIYDPAALPDDYDIRGQTEPIEIIEPLVNGGAIYWLNTSADGAYRLGLILGDRLPGEIAGFARKLETVDRFQAPSGRLYFTGIEYAFRHDDSRLRKYPQMGSFCEIPPGVYRLTVYEMDYFEDFQEVLFRKRDSSQNWRMASRINQRIPLGCLGASPLIVGLAFLPSQFRLWAVLFLVCGLSLAATFISRLPGYREMKALKSSITRENREYWATLEIEPELLFG